MKDYVLLAASQDNSLGRECTALWKNYNDSADADADTAPALDHPRSDQVSSVEATVEKAT
jgi:hypothetical protein